MGKSVIDNPDCKCGHSWWDHRDWDTKNCVHCRCGIYSASNTESSSPSPAAVEAAAREIWEKFRFYNAGATIDEIQIAAFAAIISRHGLSGGEDAVDDFTAAEDHVDKWVQTIGLEIARASALAYQRGVEDAAAIARGVAERMAVASDKSMLVGQDAAAMHQESCAMNVWAIETAIRALIPPAKEEGK